MDVVFRYAIAIVAGTCHRMSKVYISLNFVVEYVVLIMPQYPFHNNRVVLLQIVFWQNTLPILPCGKFFSNKANPTTPLN